jgi:hypothetical protein
MSKYRDLLKALDSKKSLANELTELTQAPSVSSVSASGRRGLRFELAAKPASSPLLRPVRPEVANTGSASGRVPERCLDAWARLQRQRPADIDETCWRQATVYDRLKYREWANPYREAAGGNQAVRAEWPGIEFGDAVPL